MGFGVLRGQIWGLRGQIWVKSQKSKIDRPHFGKFAWSFFSLEKSHKRKAHPQNRAFDFWDWPPVGFSCIAALSTAVVAEPPNQESGDKSLRMCDGKSPDS